MLKSLVLCLQMSGSSLTEDAWLKHCRCTLVWATRLMTFSKYLQAENDIYSIALSLIIELPPTVEVYILMQIDLMCLWIELYTHCTVLLKMFALILSYHAHRDGKEPKKKFSCLWYFFPMFSVWHVTVWVFLWCWFSGARNTRETPSRAQRLARSIPGWKRYYDGPAISPFQMWAASF